MVPTIFGADEQAVKNNTVAVIRIFFIISPTFYLKVHHQQDEVTLGRLFTVAAKIAKEEGIAEDGYRLIVNCNKHGGQEVFHIHMHLVGGESLGRMLANNEKDPNYSNGIIF